MSFQINEELLEQIIVDALNRSSLADETTGSVARSIRLQDSQNIDAFNRLRVSQNARVLGNYQHVLDKNPLFMSEKTGSLSTIHDANRAAVRMRVGQNTTDEVIRQSKQYHTYQSGQSMLCFFTFGSGSQESSITKEVGYFDDDNGLFLRIPPTGQEISFVIRSNVTGTPTETVIPQSQWNVDQLDGNGTSGKTLDISKAQLFLVDFQWLGVGRVRFGFDLDGIITYCHQTSNANNLETVYMSQGNLPVRYRIKNEGSGSATEFHQLCSSVIREGGDQEVDILTAVANTSASGTSISNSGPEAILHVRLKDGYRKTTAKLVDSFPSVFGSTADWNFKVVLNAEFSNGEPTGSYNPVGRSLEFSETKLLYVAGTGHPLVDISFVGGTFNGIKNLALEQSVNGLNLGANIDGEPDVISVIFDEPAFGNQTAAASLSFLEQL